MKTKDEHGKKISKEMYFVSKKMGSAIADYHMLQDGDKVIVAVSGGKDSLTLLKLLRYRQAFVPIKFDIVAVHVDMGFPGFPVDVLEQFFKREEIKYHIEEVDILQGKRWEDINCFWCSWNRRKILFQLADKWGFTKIAYGHHMDDIIETILLNLFYQGEIGAMCPRQDLFEGKLSVIRPFAYVEEYEIKRVVKEENIMLIDNYECPNNDVSKRMLMKQMICDLEKTNKDVKKNIFRSLQRVKKDYLL